MEVNAEPKPTSTTETHLEPSTETESHNPNSPPMAVDATLTETHCEPACEVEEGNTEPTKHTGITETHPKPPMEVEFHDTDLSAAVNSPPMAVDATLIETHSEPACEVEEGNTEPTKHTGITETHPKPPMEVEFHDTDLSAAVNSPPMAVDATLIETHCESACEVEEGNTEPTKHTGITETHPKPPMEVEFHDTDLSAAVNSPPMAVDATLTETHCEPPPNVESAASEHTENLTGGESSDAASPQTAPEDTQMETSSETLDVATTPELQQTSQSLNCENTDVDTPTSPVENAISLPEEGGVVREGEKEEEKGSNEVVLSGVKESTPRQEATVEGSVSEEKTGEPQSEESVQEGEKADTAVGENSRDATPEVGGVLTEAMLIEERRLRERESRESSWEGEEVQELSELREQQRYTRLQHLLQKSSIYSGFLLSRMEKQIGEQKKQGHHGRRKKIIQPSGGTKGEGAGQKGEGSQLQTQVSGSQEPDSKKGKKKRGRKRKAADSNFQLSDYMDSQGQLKKKRKLEGGEAGPPPPTTHTCPGGSKSMEDELEEERYYNGQLISVRQPRLLTGGVMRDYQLDGMEWIQVLYENGVNGILADEMGLGKTIQCIGVIAHLIEMGVKGPFLVAAPLSTVPNWVAEFKKFTPTIPVVLYHGTVAEREELRKKIFISSLRRRKNKGAIEELQPVIVTSYEICMKDQRYLANQSWKFLIVDEGHRIKNLNCKLIKALKSYDAANRLLLTGTPLQNNLAELWSLLNFLLPDIFDDLNSFQSWFDFDVAGEDEVRERIIAQEREQHVLSILHQILTPFLLRRLKTDVEFSLPPKKEVLVYAPLTASQERYYKSLLDRTIMDMVEEGRKKKMKELGKENAPAEEEGGSRTSRRKNTRNGYAQLTDQEFESIMKGEAELDEIVKPTPEVEEQKPRLSVTNIKMTNVFMMLRKCCNHPYLLEFPMTLDGQFRVDEELVNSCGKIMLLDRMIPALIEGGHKMLVFSQFTQMLDILEDFLDLKGLRYGRLDGSMTFSDRERQMTIFREDPDCYIFLLSTRAGGLGINLTAADTVIIYDSDWNPQADLQAQDRCHRIGQTRPVMVYRLVTANTIDQRVVERAASKRRLEKMVIHRGKFKGYGTNREDEQLSVDDLVGLLQSVDHEKVVSSSDAVISNEALFALLDRSFSNKKNPKVDSSARPTEEKHVEIFKILEERDEHGNTLRSMEGDPEIVHQPLA